MAKSKFVLIGLAVASICAASVFAQSATQTPGACGQHGKRGAGRLIRLLMRSADLTADQETQVHQILDANRPAAKDLLTQLRQARGDLATLLLGPQDVQADTVVAQQAHMAQIRQQLAQLESSTVLAIRAILTPDQLAKALAAKDQKPAWMHDGKQKHKCSGNGQ